MDGKSFELSANQYPGSVHPDGFQYIAEFRLDPFPVWSYEINGVVLERKVFMAYGSNTTAVRWSILSSPSGTDVRLEVRPLLAFVDYHHLQHDDASFKTEYDEQPGLYP